MQEPESSTPSNPDLSPTTARTSSATKSWVAIVSPFVILALFILWFIREKSFESVVGIGTSILHIINTFTSYQRLDRVLAVVLVALMLLGTGIVITEQRIIPFTLSGVTPQPSLLTTTNTTTSTLTPSEATTITPDSSRTVIPATSHALVIVSDIFEVSARQFPFVSIPIDIKQGDTVKIEVQGSSPLWNCGGLDTDVGPQGVPDIEKQRTAILPEANFCELIGRIGQGPFFKIANSTERKIDSTGKLILGANDAREDTCSFKEGCYADNTGAISVKVTVIPAP